STRTSPPSASRKPTTRPTRGPKRVEQRDDRAQRSTITNHPKAIATSRLLFSNRLFCHRVHLSPPSPRAAFEHGERVVFERQRENGVRGLRRAPECTHPTSGTSASR